jgi:hypothetical protein
MTVPIRAFRVSSASCTPLEARYARPASKREALICTLEQNLRWRIESRNQAVLIRDGHGRRATTPAAVAANPIGRLMHLNELALAN